MTDITFFLLFLCLTEHVHVKEMFYGQIFDFQVGIQRNNTLYALCDGTVVVSCEKLNPYPDSPLYQRIKDGMTIYKKFWNVYPTPVHAKFKLVSES